MASNRQIRINDLFTYLKKLEQQNELTRIKPEENEHLRITLHQRNAYLPQGIQQCKFNLVGKNIFFHTIPVKAIKYIISYRYTDIKQVGYQFYLEIIIAQDKILFAVKTEHIGHYLKSIFESLGAIFERSHALCGWEKQPFSFWQNTKITYETLGMTSFYRKLHEILADRVVDWVNKHSISAMALFSFGCGNGDDIKSALNGLNKKKGLTVATMGFDFQKENIRLANKNIHLYPNCQFREGNTLDLFNLHRTYFLQSADHKKQKKDLFFAIKQQENFKTFILFCGAVNRDVLDGTLDGLKVIQQALRCSDGVLLSGYSDPLISTRLAKRCGWQYKIDQVEVLTHKTIIYFLEKSSPLMRLGWLKKECAKNKTVLNLSMSADPVNDLSLLIENKIDISKFTVIDLQWTLILPNEKEKLIQILQSMEALTTIKFSSVDKQNLLLLKEYKKYHLEIIQAADECELPEFSQPFVERYGLKPTV